MPPGEPLRPAEVAAGGGGGAVRVDLEWIEEEGHHESPLWP